MRWNENIWRSVEAASQIEEVLAELNFPPDLTAKIYEKVLRRVAVENYVDVDIRQIITKETRDVLDEKLTAIPKRENENGEPKKDQEFIGVYTGQFNPPTKGHEAFLRNLIDISKPSGVRFVITGPDSERMPDTRQLGYESESGFTPLGLRRFIFEQFLRRVFPQELNDKFLVLYPEELTGGDFANRIKLWHKEFSRNVVFCVGADTLFDILKWQPETILTGPIICMRRTDKQGHNVEIPEISRDFFLKLMQSTMRDSGPHLLSLFQNHSYLAPFLQSWCGEFPHLSLEKIDGFFKQQTMTAIDFSHHLLGSERFQDSAKAGKELRRNLERFKVFANLATNPFKLARLRSHISTVDTEEDSNSSTRDRQLIAHLPPITDELKPVLLGETIPTNTQLVTTFLQTPCTALDWTNLKPLIDRIQETDPKALVGAIRQIVHSESLRILYDCDLLDIYSSRPQKEFVPVSPEILAAALPCSDKFALLHPDQIARLSPPAQFHLARALAGIHYKWEHDAPDAESYVPRNVLHLLAHTAAERNFIPSMLLDRNSGDIIAILAAFIVHEPSFIKYTGVNIDPRFMNDPKVVSLVNDFVDRRINYDREGSQFEKVNLMIVEVPAHDMRFIEQHILGGSKFMPCGLEPSMDSARSYVLWTVMGIHIRHLVSQQGDYYIITEAKDLVDAVNRLINQTYNITMRYQCFCADSDSDEALPPTTEMTHIPDIPPKLIHESPESCDYQVGHMSFSIYPGKSRQLDAQEFQDPYMGPFLLSKAIDCSEQLYAEGTLPRPYIKIAVPIDSPHSLQLQRILRERGFLPVRFVPKTKRMPPTLTFCRILPPPPRMNGIELPLARVAGNPDANRVFIELQTIGRKLEQHGHLEPTALPTTSMHINRGRKKVSKSKSASAIFIKKGCWDVFPTLFAHYSQMMQALYIVRRNNIPFPSTDGKHREKLLTTFIKFHDSGKAIWAMANRFCNDVLGNVEEPLEPAELTSKLTTYLTSDFDKKKESHSPDWNLENQRIDIAYILQFIAFNSEKKRYETKPDALISAALVNEYCETHTDMMPSSRQAFLESAHLYTYFNDDNFMKKIYEINPDDEKSVRSLLEEPDIFYFLLLEFIDNTSRYRITTNNGLISLREVWNVLELKKQEVLCRYGQDLENKKRIEKRFSLLKKVGEIFFAKNELS